MNNGHSFTYIIGYRHKPDRLQNLRRVLDWINGFQGVDVIVVEQDTHSKISHLSLRCRHLFLKSDKPYNKSWSFNYATKMAKSNIIVFADSDLIMHPNQLIDALKQIETYDMVNPYKSVVDLQPNEAGLQLEQIIQIVLKAQQDEQELQKVKALCNNIIIRIKSHE